MKEMKFRIKSPEHSIRIQRELRRLGYNFLGNPQGNPMYINQPILIAREGGRIQYSSDASSFKKKNYPESNLKELKLM